MLSKQLTGNQEESGVHDGGSVQHSGHKNVVTGAIDETDMTHQLEATGARWPIAWEAIVFAGATRGVADRARTLGVVAFEDLCIGITCGSGS